MVSFGFMVTGYIIFADVTDHFRLFNSLVRLMTAARLMGLPFDKRRGVTTYEKLDFQLIRFIGLPVHDKFVPLTTNINNLNGSILA
jgi:hypothetical protein